MIAASIAMSPAPAQAADNGEASLSLENRTLLRCAAAFALLSRAQEAGEEASQKWPELGDRGREFFVRALAQVMDQSAMGREEISQATGDEAQKIQQTGELDKIMPACLLMLENSGV